MSARRRLVLLALVALQALVPLALIGGNELALARGQEVRLKTVPVDPVDLFRGRYVALRYEISAVPDGGRLSPGDTAYVSLEQRGDRWVAVAASPLRPRDATFIRGRVLRAGDSQVEVEYGIETYYADEEEALRLERDTAQRGLYVDVVLDDDGQARIAGVEPVR